MLICRFVEVLKPSRRTKSVQYIGLKFLDHGAEVHQYGDTHRIGLCKLCKTLKQMSEVWDSAKI